jgi:hypothetical protein
MPEGVLKFYFEYNGRGPHILFWIFPRSDLKFSFEFSGRASSNSTFKIPCLRCEYVTFCETTRLQGSNVETFLTQSFVIKNNYVYNTRNTSFTSLCYTPFCFNALCQFKPLLNLRSLIFGLTPFGWLLFIVLTSYFWWKHNFSFTIFYTLSFRGTQLGRKTRIGCIILRIIIERL